MFVAAGAGTGTSRMGAIRIFGSSGPAVVSVALFLLLFTIQACLLGSVAICTCLPLCSITWTHTIHPDCQYPNVDDQPKDNQLTYQ